MKIHLTIEEIKIIVSRQLQVPLENLKVVINYPNKKSKPTGLFRDLLTRLTKVGALTEHNTIRPESKILAIKEFRTFYFDLGHTSVSLAEAKYAIEEWDRFYSYSLKNGLPNYSDLETYCWRFK